MRISAQLAEATKPGHVRCSITRDALTVKVGALGADGAFAMTTLLDGPLFQEIDAAESAWNLIDSGLGSKQLSVRLKKARPMRWLMLLRNECDAPPEEGGGAPAATGGDATR